MREVADPFSENSGQNPSGAAAKWKTDHGPVGPDFGSFNVVPRCIQSLRDGRSYVYFIGGEGTPVKIGVSTAPYERLAALQTAHWVRLVMLARIEGGADTEAELHDIFAADRLVGEWFTRSPALERCIEQVRAVHGVPDPFYVPAIDTRPKRRRLTQPTPSLASGPCAFGVAA